MNKKDMKTLANKVIVITGASSGIGEAMAKVYAAQGAKVVLGARNVQKLQLLAGDIRARGGAVTLIVKYGRFHHISAWTSRGRRSAAG